MVGDGDDARWSFRCGVGDCPAGEPARLWKLTPQLRSHWSIATPRILGGHRELIGPILIIDALIPGLQAAAITQPNRGRQHHRPTRSSDVMPDLRPCPRVRTIQLTTTSYVMANPNAERIAIPYRRVGTDRSNVGIGERLTALFPEGSMQGKCRFGR